MAMNAAYLDAIRDAGQGLITHVGLVNSAGTELASASYARQPVTWTDDGAGVSRLGGDEVFNMTAGDEVAGWQGYSALTAGTAYGPVYFDPATPANGAFTFGNDGTFTLAAAQTTITHTAT